MQMPVKNKFGTGFPENSAQFPGIEQALAGRNAGIRGMMDEDDSKQLLIGETPKMLVESVQLSTAEPAGCRSAKQRHRRCAR